MKKIIFLLVALFGSQNIRAVEPWIKWNNPSYITLNEFTGITSALSVPGRILPGKMYTLSTGDKFSIAHPKEYFECIVMCVKANDPSAKTVEDVLKDIQEGDVQIWTNDVSCKVKNLSFEAAIFLKLPTSQRYFFKKSDLE